MVFFPLSGVFRGLSGCDVQQYASPETLACPAIAHRATADQALLSEKNPHFWIGHILCQIFIRGWILLKFGVRVDGLTQFLQCIGFAQVGPGTRFLGLFDTIGL